MESAPPEPTLQDIAAARAAVSGSTPSAVLAAFLPKPETHLGRALLPLTAGHDLLLSQFQHPFITGAPFEDIDVLLALFIFSHPSRDLFALVAADQFEREFFKFLDAIPQGENSQLGHDMMAHWLRSRATALEMQDPHATTQKKTAVSVGS